jgi:hypothetical protein
MKKFNKIIFKNSYNPKYIHIILQIKYYLQTAIIY